jgi:hypothetical protein
MDLEQELQLMKALLEKHLPGFQEELEKLREDRQLMDDENTFYIEDL